MPNSAPSGNNRRTITSGQVSKCCRWEAAAKEQCGAWRPLFYRRPLLTAVKMRTIPQLAPHMEKKKNKREKMPQWMRSPECGTTGSQTSAESLHARVNRNQSERHYFTPEGRHTDGKKSPGSPSACYWMYLTGQGQGQRRFFFFQRVDYVNVCSRGGGGGGGGEGFCLLNVFLLFPSAEIEHFRKPLCGSFWFFWVF